MDKELSLINIKGTNSPIEKQTKDVNRHFTEWEQHIINKHMKRDLKIDQVNAYQDHKEILFVLK